MPTPPGSHSLTTPAPLPTERVAYYSAANLSLPPVLKSASQGALGQGAGLRPEDSK